MFGYPDFFFFNSKWGETESLGTVATTGLLYEPRMIGDGDCGEICGMKIGRGNRSMDVYMYVYVYSMFVLSCVGRGLTMS
jgi:hypothetical protein